MRLKAAFITGLVLQLLQALYLWRKHRLTVEGHGVDNTGASIFQR